MNDLRYLTDSYDEKISRIKEIGAPLNFVFITDQHNRFNQVEHKKCPYELAVNAINSIHYILERCPEISFVVSGGDIGCDYDPDPMKVRESYKEVMDALYSLPVPVYCCVGNHDDAIGIAAKRGWDTMKSAVLPEEMHNLCMKYNPKETNYYYIDMDVAEGDWRFIFLNTTDLPYYVENGQYKCGFGAGFSVEQVLWLQNDALVTERNIIIFSHIPLSNVGMFGTQSLPVGIKPFEELCRGSLVHNLVTRCENVKMFVAGHVHFDNLVFDDRILSITTLCSLAQEWAPSCPKREFGTPTETAFDVISIKENMAYMTRFGAGADRCAVLLRMMKRPEKYHIF